MLVLRTLMHTVLMLLKFLSAYVPSTPQKQILPFPRTWSALKSWAYTRPLRSRTPWALDLMLYFFLASWRQALAASAPAEKLLWAGLGLVLIRAWVKVNSGSISIYFMIVVFFALFSFLSSA